jgi:hypothetical protein
MNEHGWGGEGGGGQTSEAEKLQDKREDDRATAATDAS